MLEDIKLEDTIEPLLEWFFVHARTLPWRSDPKPYHVWVSEIMLQQTRVEAVRPYYARFIKKLPDVQSLAGCKEDVLLKLWEGLGYYNRVRNMQKAAKQIVEEYEGVLPGDYDTLLKLKGIGRYTAGAIASIACGRSVPAVDGNVLRVMTRLTADDSDIMKQPFRLKVERILRELLENISVSERIKKRLYQGNLPGTINQAWMELGAVVCLPNGEPLCAECPWRDICRAKKQGKTGVIPVKSKKKERKIEQRTVFIIRQGDKIALGKRPQNGLLAGLYELPNITGRLDMEEALSYLKQKNFLPIRIEPLAEAKHIFSHIEWHMTGFAVRIEEADYAGRETENEDNLIFVEAEDVKRRYAIPAAFSAYAKYLNITPGAEYTGQEKV